MKEIIDYQVVRNDRLDAFNKMIQELIKQGWQPLGGAFHAGDYSGTLNQTLVKYSPL